MNFELCPDKKGEITNFDPVTSLKLLIYPFLLGLHVNVARFARKLFWASDRFIKHILNLLGHPVDTHMNKVFKNKFLFVKQAPSFTQIIHKWTHSFSR